MSNILEKIISDKKKDIDEYKSVLSVDDLKKKIVDFALTEFNLSIVTNYLKVMPIIGKISLNLNVPVQILGLNLKLPCMPVLLPCAVPMLDKRDPVQNKIENPLGPVRWCLVAELFPAALPGDRF